jgi:AcrR family transcriptional regulator
VLDTGVTGENFMMGKKRLTSEQRRNQILEVAAFEFARTGLEITRIKDIAEICNINEALIYQHFPCKDDLYASAMDHMQTEMLGGWRALISKRTSGLDALKVLQRTRGEVVAQNPYLATAIEYAALASVSDERLRQMNEKTFKAVQEMVEDLVRKGQEDGSIRKDLNPTSVAFMVRGFSHLVNYQIITGLSDEPTFQKHFDNLMDLLRPVSECNPPSKAKALPSKPVKAPAKKASAKPKPAVKKAVATKGKKR